MVAGQDVGLHELEREAQVRCGVDVGNGGGDVMKAWTAALIFALFIGFYSVTNARVVDWYLPVIYAVWFISAHRGQSARGDLADQTLVLGTCGHPLGWPDCGTSAGEGLSVG